MGFSFSKWLIVNEVFNLNSGQVLNLVEALQLGSTAQRQIKKFNNMPYKPGPNNENHLVAAVLGYKPCAIVRYDHHPESPAAAVVSDELKASDTKNSGQIQAELLAHGIKVRPDFHIVHMNLPGYSTRNIIVGGKEPSEELWKLYKCQYYLDFISSPDHANVTPDVISKVNNMLHGRCDVFCKRGYAGMDCQPIHKRIGQLLGYTEEQVNDFLKSMGGYNHIPDVKYPIDLPSSIEKLPRKKGFVPNETKFV